MKVLNIAGFPFTLPVHLCPINVKITIPYDGNVYDVPDVVFNEEGLKSILRVIQPPILNQNIQPSIKPIPIIYPEITNKQLVPEQPIKKPRCKRTTRNIKGKDVDPVKPLKRVKISKETRKIRKRNVECQFDFSGKFEDEVVKNRIEELEKQKEVKELVQDTNIIKIDL